MKYSLDKFGYTTSKSALKRHVILKRINKKYGFKHLLEILTLKLKRTPKNRINERRILRADLKWVKGQKKKLLKK